MNYEPELLSEEYTTDVDRNLFEQVFTPDVRRTVHIIRQYGFDVRVVGGAVRDFILGKPPRDIDFATDAEPSELIYIFNLEEVEFDAWGIVHGTVKAVFGEDKVDVTSICYKLSLGDDKKVKITRNTSWETDAYHRDLTINSISIDMNGKLHDYVGGVEDLKNSMVRINTAVIPNLTEDPHLIMRWFKALGNFEDPKFPKSNWEAVKAAIPSLAKIRDEEKTEKELNAIRSSKHADRTLEMMRLSGADKFINL